MPRVGSMGLSRRSWVHVWEREDLRESPAEWRTVGDAWGAREVIWRQVWL